MRTIIFKEGKHIADPVKIGDIFKLRHGNNWYTVIAVPESEYASCKGCVLVNTETCMVPTADGDVDSICGKAECVFRSVDTIMEDL